MTHQRTVVQLARAVIGIAVVGGINFMIALRIQASHINIVNSDSLYIPLLHEGRLLSFRPPSSNYLFPDYLYYALAHTLDHDVIRAMVTAGLIQCAVVTLLVIRYCGLLPAIAYGVLYYQLSLPEYVSITYHQSLILMTLLYLRFDRPYARRSMSFAFAAVDPLFSFVQAVLMATRALFEKTLDMGEVLLIALGFAVAFYLCESSYELLKFGPALAVVLATACAIAFQRPRAMILVLQKAIRLAESVRLNSYRTASSLLLCASLLLLLLAQPLRYTLPILVCAVILFFWKPGAVTRDIRSRWCVALISAPLAFAILYELAKPSIEAASRASLTKYSCLSEKIDALHAPAIATDYWTFKPLYFFKASASQFDIMPLNFSDGTPFIWANDHRFAKGRSRYIVKDVERCRSFVHAEHQLQTNCVEDWYTAKLGVKSRTQACDRFEIIETDVALDFAPFTDEFRSKHSAFLYNLQKNMEKFRTRLNK